LVRFFQAKNEQETYCAAAGRYLLVAGGVGGIESVGALGALYQ
jgi:hypothetical protein